MSIFKNCIFRDSSAFICSIAIVFFSTVLVLELISPGPVPFEDLSRVSGVLSGVHKIGRRAPKLVYEIVGNDGKSIEIISHRTKIYDVMKSKVGSRVVAHYQKDYSITHIPVTNVIRNLVVDGEEYISYKKVYKNMKTVEKSRLRWVFNSLLIATVLGLINHLRNICKKTTR